MTVQKSTILEKFEDTGLTDKMTSELYELIDICSQYNLSKFRLRFVNGRKLSAEQKRDLKFYEVETVLKPPKKNRK